MKKKGGNKKFPVKRTTKKAAGKWTKGTQGDLGEKN